MKQRIQNRIIARSVNATVVMFVIQLFLLFDKTESGEPSEPSDSTDSTDSTDSMFSRKVTPIWCRKASQARSLISGVSRLCDELCSQLCEINKASAHSAAQLKN